jgi:putative inorganic carbon (hco3(-)) transporter
LLFIYLIDSTRTRQDVLFVVALLLIGLVLESVIVLGVRVTGHTIELGPIAARLSEGNRMGGTVGSPNDTAGLFSLLLVPALSILMARVRTSYRVLAMVAFGAGGLALVFTLSRGGWVAFALSVALFYILARPGKWLPIRVQVFMVIAISVLLIMFEGLILKRFTVDDRGAAESRVGLMKVAFQMIQEQPLLGVGPNNYGSELENYRGFYGDSDTFWLFTVHNKYLLLWAEDGIGGLLAFLFFVAFIIRRGWQCWQFKDPVLSPIALGFVAALAGQLVHMMVESYNNRPQVQSLWLVAGVMAAMSLMERKD